MDNKDKLEKVIESGLKSLQSEQCFDFHLDRIEHLPKEPMELLSKSLTIYKRTLNQESLKGFTIALNIDLICQSELFFFTPEEKLANEIDSFHPPSIYIMKQPTGGLNGLKNEFHRRPLSPIFFNLDSNHTSCSYISSKLDEYPKSEYYRSIWIETVQ